MSAPPPPETPRHILSRWDLYLWLSLAVGCLLLLGLAIWLLGVTIPYDGMWIKNEDNRWVVQEVLEPAQGIFQPGDVIIEVDHRPAHQGWMLYTGKRAGDIVTYRIARQGEFLTVSLRLRGLTFSEYFFRLAPVIVAAFFWGIGVYVLACRPGGFQHRLFFLFCMTSSCALSSGALSGIVPYLANYLYFIALCFLGPVAIHLHLYFPCYIPLAQSRRFLLALYGSAGTIGLLSFSRFLFDSQIVRQVLHTLPFLNLVLSFAAVVALLVRAWQSRQGEERRQVGIVAVGAAMGLTPLTFLSLLPDIFFDGPILQYYYTLPCLSVIPLAYGYAIWRYALIRRGRYLSRTIVQAFVAVLLVCLYLFLFTGLQYWFPAVKDNHLWAALLVGLLALIATPLQRNLQSTLDNLLYSGWYDYRSLISGAAQSFSGVESLNQLGELLAGLLEKLHLSGGMVLFLDENGQNLEVKHVFRWTHPPTLKKLVCQGALAACLQNAAMPQTSAEIAVAVDAAPLSPQERAWLDTTHIQLWVPLVYRGVLQGLLLLGNRPGYEPFDTEDRRILSTLAYQAALAATNVRLVEALNRRAAEVRHLYSQLLQAREEERKSLAREIHDQVIQDLINIHFHLGVNAPSFSPDPAEQASALRQRVQAVIAELRQICSQLRPAALDDLSLNSAIRGYVEDILVSHPLEIHLDLPDDENAFDATLPEDVGLTLFRVLQEGLANILRHASASQVYVKLTFDTAWASLEIRDDGCGFEMPPRLGQFIRQQHFGLAGLQERLDLVGGRLEVSSAIGKGTTLRACVPYSPPAPCASPLRETLTPTA